MFLWLYEFCLMEFNSYSKINWVCPKCYSLNSDSGDDIQQCWHCDKPLDFNKISKKKVNHMPPEWAFDECKYLERKADYESRGEKMPHKEVQMRSRYRLREKFNPSLRFVSRGVAVE